MVQRRDGWVTVGGTRNGTYLVYWGDTPRLCYATDPANFPAGQVFMLGVAHKNCIGKARLRIQSGDVHLPDELPDLLLEQGTHIRLPPHTLDRPTEAGLCPFCDAKWGLTEEHIWPGWYSDELQRRGAALNPNEVVRNNRIEITVLVCGECNHNWMSVLENDCKGILTRMFDSAICGTPVELTVAQQERLATWAVKTAYLIDAYQAPVIPRGFLQELALQRTPNPWTVIWVGGYTPDVASRADRRTMNYLTTTGEPTLNSPNAFAITFTIMNVIFQVTGHFNGGSATLRDHRKQYNEALFRIWPDRGEPLSWPPQVGFSGASWEDLIASMASE